MLSLSESERQRQKNAEKEADFVRRIPVPFTKEQIQNPTEEEFYQIANYRNNIHIPICNSGLDGMWGCSDSFTPKTRVDRSAWESFQEIRELREKVKAMPKDSLIGDTWLMDGDIRTLTCGKVVFMDLDDKESIKKTGKGDSPSSPVEVTVSSAKAKQLMGEVEGKKFDMKEKRKMVEPSAGLPLEKKMKLQDAAEQVVGESPLVSFCGEVVDLMREEIRRQMNAMKREMKSQMEMQLESFWKEAEEKLLLSLTSKFSGEYTKSPTRTTSKP